MNRTSKQIIDEMLQEGLITSECDLTGDDQKTNFIFDYMLKRYGYIINHEVNNEDQLKDRKLFHKIIMTFGKYFLKNPQVFEPGSHHNDSHDEPVIYLSNHRFRDDILGSILAIKDGAVIFFGSTPQFYGTIDGLLLSKNGIVLVNRKIKENRAASVRKTKNILENGKNLLMFPEGVWNKSPNRLMLDLYSGFYRIAQKEDGTFYKVVPIVHYIRETNDKDKKNVIHTYVDEPIDLSGMTKEEAEIYVRDRMATIYYELMEKYGQSTREEVLGDSKDSTEAWEKELVKRVATADKYDIEIETSADKKNPDDPLRVWEPIANLEVTRDNAHEVAEARKLVKQLKRNDFQHKF